MGGQTTTTQNTSQQSQTQPWTAAQPQLLGLLGSLGNVNTSVTPAQTGAVGAVQAAAAGIPNYAPQIENTAGALFGGGANESPILTGAYGALQGNLAPLANPANLDPRNTPGFGAALAALNNNITNQVNDQFAAAGRDLSPANTQALATGLSQGEGQLLANQYNANVGSLINANSQLFGAGNTTATGVTGMNPQQLQNMLAGTSLAGSLPQLLTAPAQAQLSAANAAQGLPLANLAGYEQLLTPLAALGSETSGTSQGTTTQSVPLAQQIAGGAIGGLGLFGSLGGGGLGLFGNLLNRGANGSGGGNSGSNSGT
jgi:hypothetical protein